MELFLSFFLSETAEKLLYSLSAESQLDHRSRHSAIIVKNRIVLAKGVNKMKSHTLAAKFAKHEEAIYLHAEIDAIVKAVNRYGPKLIRGAELVVCRVLRSGELGNSCPCKGCRAALEAFGLHVTYSTKGGWFNEKNNSISPSRNFSRSC